MATLTAANTPQLLYTCPASRVAAKNVRFANTGSASATYWVWKGTATAPTSAAQTGDEWASGFPIGAVGSVNSVGEVTGIHMTAGEKLYAMVSNTAVSVNVHGPERNV